MFSNNPSEDNRNIHQNTQSYLNNYGERINGLIKDLSYAESNNVTNNMSNTNNASNTNNHSNENSTVKSIYNPLKLISRNFNIILLAFLVFMMINLALVFDIKK